MSTPLYREILTDSWQMTRRHPWLWLFGLFAMFLGNSSALEIFWRVLYSSQPASDWSPVRNFFSIGLIDSQVAVWSFVLFSLLAVAIVLAVFIVVTANGALILGIAQYRKSGKVNVSQLWQKAAKKFLPLLGITLIFKILVIGLTWIIGAPLDAIVAGRLSAAMMAFFPLVFVATALASVILSFLSIYASAFILLKNKSFFQAAALSWRLFVNHWLVSLEMAMIIFGVSFLLGLLALVGIAGIGLPLFFILIFSQAVVLPILGLFAFGVAWLAFILFMLWLLTIFTVFQAGCWTLLFLRMQEGRAASKIMRMFTKVWSLMGV